MGHQTFFIDIDEEITSIAERIRKADSDEVILVVPKRALLIQSIVNLKLLQKEANNLKKRLSIVTQDKLGKVLVEKVGIEVKQKLEDEDIEMAANPSVIDKKDKKDIAVKLEPEAVEAIQAKIKRRPEKIGSDSFFEEISGAKEEIKGSELENDWEDVAVKKTSSEEDVPEEKIVNRELVVDIASDIKKKRATSMDVSVRPKKEKFVEIIPDEKEDLEEFSSPAALNFPGAKRNPRLPDKKMSTLEFSSERIEEEDIVIPDRDEKLESFFSGAKRYEDEKDDGMDDFSGRKKQGGTNKFFKAIMILFLIAGIGGLSYIAYVFVPKATIIITAKNEEKSGDVEVVGDAKASALDYSKNIIPAKLVKVDDEVSENYESTGSKSVSNKKAKGMIIIYNEYSSSPQPLVATTRFLSSDNKLFRLVKQTTVPGMIVEGGVSKSGSIEAEVVADEPGSSFNIGPTTFSIPGFKDSGADKYAKFYAKSTSDMTGGGSGNEEMASISDHDIANAKNSISSAIQNSIKEKLKNAAGEGFIVLDDAIDIAEPTYKLSNSLGEVVGTFEATANASAQALAFSESDLKKLTGSAISRSGTGKADIDTDNITLEYGKATPDFTLGTIDIRVHADSNFQRSIDVENLKKGLLGKNNEELEAYLRTYSEIDKVEVRYWPQFFTSHIPIYESRVEVILDK